MVRILLDTNILHQEGLNSTRFQVLQRLIKSGDVSLFVPEIVIKEYKSKRTELANEELKKINSAMDNLDRKSIIEKDKYAVRELIGYISSSIKSAEIEVDLWIKENKVTVIPISDTSIEEIFNNYFSGVGAFRKPKSREDIPDAVIFDCIKRLSLEGELFVIAKDGVLLDALKEVENVIKFKDLSEIMEISPLKNKLDELNLSEMKVSSIIETLSNFDSEYAVSEYLTDNYLVEVEGYYDEEFSELPYELGELELDTYEVNVKNLKELFVDSPKYLGNGKFVYSLSAECDASISFNCKNDAYESLPYEYRKVLLKRELDSQVDVKVEGEVTATLRGTVELTGIDTDIDSSKLDVHLSYLGAERSQIDCNVNLEKLTVESIY